MTRARDLSEIVNSTGLSVDTDTLVVDSANNRVGIGTDSSATTLHITKDGNQSAVLDAYEAQQVSHNTIAYTRWVQNASGIANIMGVDSAAGILGTSSNHALAIRTNNTERMRIDSGGTTTIKTDGSTQLVLNRADASIQNGNQIANLLVTGDDPSAGQSGAAISFIAGDAWATNSYPTNITFSNDLSGTLTERMRIDASGNVGIGTSSLTQKFEVIQGAGATTRAVIGGGAQAMLVINGDRDNSGDSGLEDASLVFASDGVYDGTGNPNFGYRIGHANASASNALIFTGIKSEVDYERMRVDSSGNLLVGKTSTSIDTAGHTIFASGEVFHTVAGTPLYVNRTGSDGPIQNFYKDGAPVGSIGVDNNDNFYIGATTSGHSGFYFGNTNVAPMAAGTKVDNTIDLGTSDNRFIDLHLSGGVVLDENPTIVGTTVVNRTITSKTLDDYEEGTWIPAIAGWTGTFVGTYTKTGNTVFYALSTGTLSGSGSDIIEITGLPFDPSASQASGTVMAQHVNTSTGTANLVGYTMGGSKLRIYETLDNAGWNALTESSLTSGSSQFIISGTYTTA